MRLLYFACFMLLLTGSNVLAQDTATEESPLNDPLNKPNIWSSLAQSPLDSVLWTMYLGKPWVSMTYQEKENIDSWKQFLREQLGGVAVEEPSSVDDAELWDDVPAVQVVESKRQAEEKMAQAQYLSQLESMMLSEPRFLSDLKSNVKANFIVIEDTYKEEFDQLGVDYEYYYNKYPNGNYSQDLWVKEKSEELRRLKMKEFEKIKMQLVGNGN